MSSRDVADVSDAKAEGGHEWIVAVHDAHDHRERRHISIEEQGTKGCGKGKGGETEGSRE